MMVIGTRDAIALVALVASLMGISAAVGALATWAWAEHAKATCQELRAESYEATWHASKTLDDCTCAVTGRCRR